MNLFSYDNRTVRLTHFDGLVFEGLASHNSASYNLHEIGREEEGLQIDHWLFFKSDIRSLEVIDPSEVSVWMSRKCHSLLLDHDVYDPLDNGASSIELPCSAFPEGLPEAGEMVRFEDRTDDFDVLYFEVIRAQISSDEKTVILFIAEPE